MPCIEVFTHRSAENIVVIFPVIACLAFRLFPHLSTDASEDTTHLQRTLSKVNVLPFKSKKLTTTHTSRQRQNKQSFLRMSLSSFQKLTRLICCKWVNFLMLLTRRRNRITNVPRNKPHFHSITQRFVQHTLYRAYRRR